jgi:hypothetical protein
MASSVHLAIGFVNAGRTCKVLLITRPLRCRENDMLKRFCDTDRLTLLRLGNGYPWVGNYTSSTNPSTQSGMAHTLEGPVTANR